MVYKTIRGRWGWEAEDFGLFAARKFLSRLCVFVVWHAHKGVTQHMLFSVTVKEE